MAFVIPGASFPLHRRALLGGLGAAAASLALPGPVAAAGFTPRSCAPDPDNRIRIIDCARDVTASAAAIRDSGVATVIRYYAREGGQWCGKVLSRVELTALHRAGLSVAVIFQHNNNQADFFYDETKKVEDMRWALKHAAGLNQPAGTPIYFGADFDLDGQRSTDGDGKFLVEGKGGFVIRRSAEIQRRNEDALRSYFEHANEELSKRGYKVGVYGCGAACRLLADPRRRLAEYFWLSASISYKGTTEFYNTRAWHLFQNKIELRTDLIPPQCGDAGRGEPPRPDRERAIDTNLLNSAFDDFGQWRMDGSRPVHRRAGSQRLLLGRAFANKAIVKIWSPTPGGPGPELKAPKLLYGRNVKVLCDHGDYVAISINERDLLGYCRKEDLTVSMLSIPPWPRPA